ncbi:MAG: helix-turn-helix transcriptional regulator [Desulfobacterales bacterium]|nr:helix-turn-helix transcriptional regulator [Desulfobacterales bacterium]
MNRDAEKFPKLVKEMRRQLGLSQEDLAHKLGVSFATINRWENGKTKPSRLAKTQFDTFLSQMKSGGHFYEN